MKKFFNEFKTFVTRGNVLDMAVGVIVGGAFTAIVNALSNNILKPLINALLRLILGGEGLSDIYTFLYKAVLEDGTVDLANSIYIDWGAFVSAIINFLLIAFVVFTIVKVMNHASDALNVNKMMRDQIEKKLERGEELTKTEKRWVKKTEAYHPELLPDALKPKAEVKEPEPSVPTETERLLTEILAELKKENK